VELIASQAAPLRDDAKKAVRVPPTTNRRELIRL
jgi:hypothetical protein